MTSKPPIPYEKAIGAFNTEHDSSECRHCGRGIWWMGDYSGWVHAHSWLHVCDPSTKGPVAEPLGNQEEYDRG